jgi:tetratricopeptide (TPR) repeat protein
MRMPTVPAFTATEPFVDTIVRACLGSLDEVEQRPDVLESAVRSNISPGDLRNLTPTDYDFLYATAQSLVAAKDFRRALAVALAIVAHHGREAKYSYLAGTCLHQLAFLEQAAIMYVLALQQDPSSAMTAYRLGQCLSRLDRADEASRCLAHAIELSRGNEALRQMQDAAFARLRNQRQTIQPAPQPDMSAIRTRRTASAAR